MTSKKKPRSRTADRERSGTRLCRVSGDFSERERAALRVADLDGSIHLAAEVLGTTARGALAWLASPVPGTFPGPLPPTLSAPRSPAELASWIGLDRLRRRARALGWSSVDRSDRIAIATR